MESLTIQHARQKMLYFLWISGNTKLVTKIVQTNVDFMKIQSSKEFPWDHYCAACRGEVERLHLHSAWLLLSASKKEISSECIHFWCFNHSSTLTIQPRYFEGHGEHFCLGKNPSLWWWLKGWQGEHCISLLPWWQELRAPNLQILFANLLLLPYHTCT